jgi:hypothetical protein
MIVNGLHALQFILPYDLCVCSPFDAFLTGGSIGAVPPLAGLLPQQDSQ